MGRLQPTVVVQPQATRRSDRAKRAKETMNKTIPDLLKSSPRARHGVQSALLIADPQTPHDADAERTSSGPAPTIKLRCTDTLTAARQLTSSSRRASIASPYSTVTKPKNVCILNMASPLRPGGGFLEGATSQEEFLCMRTTLLPSLWEDFYRLPEIGGVLTPDVLVHRDAMPEAADLPKRERFFVDVVTSAMLRFPETDPAAAKGADGEPACTCGVSYCDRDRELVTKKMRAVMRMVQQTGAERLVLGAWGCGAYGNPVKEVAKIWKRVLLGTIRRKEHWVGIKEVVFAIPDRAMLREFEKCFADVSSKEPVSPPPEKEASPEAAPEGQNTAELINELVSKIQETELQLDQISNPRSKARLREVIAGLNRQLAAAGSTETAEDEMPPDPVEEVVPDSAVTAGATSFLASDGEEGGYYHFDSSDVGSSGAASPTGSDVYEFRVPGPLSSHTSPANNAVKGGAGFDLDSDVDLDTLASSEASSFEHVEMGPQGMLDHDSGWFSGSINDLTTLLLAKRRSPGGRGLGSGSFGSNDGLDAIRAGLGEYLAKHPDQEY